ncbi:SdrD B-like domain-containing protein [Novipirellula herctigrandis]|uniref:SdrD B-like domain-containing protein n=1 Tax=Novipirellula herctigrandis TaxID=2527986 RepID=UPI003AF35772
MRKKRRRLTCELLESRRVLAGAGPEVLSIVRADANPTNDAQVAFEITFDEAVTGVDANDFAFAVSGVTSPSVANVTGSGTVYRAVVNTGTGDGTLRLDLIDNDSILDNQNKPLGGSGTTGNKDGSFFGAQSYTIDKTAPITTGATLVGTPAAIDATIDFNLTFSEPVSTIVASMFQLSGSASPTATISSVSGSGSSYVINVDTGGGQGDLQLDFVDDDTITDAVGNPVNGIGSQTIVGQSHTVDHVAPTVVSIVADQPSPTNAELISLEVTFDEPVVNVGLNDFQLTATDVTNAMITNVVGSSNVYTVTISTGTGDGSVQLSMSPTAMISDVAGNVLPVSSTVSSLLEIDKTLAISMSVAVVGSGFSDASSVQYDVTFPEPMLGISPGVFEVYTSGTSTLTGMSVSSVTGSGTDYTVTIDTGSGDGSLFLRLNNLPGTARDLAGNVANVIYASGSVWTIDRTAPTIDSINLVSSASSNQASVAFDVSLSESMYGLSASDFFLVTTGVSGASISSVSQNGSSLLYRVFVNTGSGNGTVSIANTTTGLGSDSAGNPFASVQSGFPSYIMDRTAPLITSLVRQDTNPTAAGSVQFGLQFSEPVENFGIDDLLVLTNGTLSGASVTSVNGDGTSFVVSVDTGSGDGDLELGTVASPTATDAAGNTIPSSYSGGEVYTLDRTTPTILMVDRVSPTVTTGNSIQYVVSYSEPVLNVQTSDFLVVTSPEATPQPAISAVGVEGATATVTVDVSSYEGAVYLYAKGGEITDAVGNPIGNQVVASQQFYVDRTPPMVTSVVLEQSTPTTLSDLSFLVTLSELINGFSSADVAIDQTGLPNAAVSSIEYVASDQRRVHVSVGQGQGSLSIDILGDQTIRDLANQKIVGDSTDHPAYVVDNLAPTVQSISLVGPNPITTSTFTFQVAFSEPVTGVSSSSFSVAATGAVSATIDSVTGSGDTYEVTVTNSGDTGTIALTVNDDDSIADALLNPLGGVGDNNGDFASATFGVGTTGRIAGRVVDDMDGDGYADLAEVGIVGVTVYVDQNGNAQYDTGEPYAETLGDDGTTTEVNEAGTYLISGVMPGEQTVRMVSPVGWLQTNPAMRASGSGQLTLVQLLQDNVGGNNALEEVAGVTESPDGNFVYVAAYTDNAVTVYSRNPSTGGLTRVQTVVNGSDGVAGLVGAQSIAITQDGQHLYVASAIDDALVMFSRDESTGLLTYLGHLKQGVGGVDGLNEATAIRESADGKNLYVASVTSSSLAVFDRDPASGLVTFSQKLTGATGNSFSVDLSPDQRHVYLSSGTSNAVNVYDRDLSTGQLTLTQTVTKASAGFSTLNEPWGISVAPDGKHVYVATRLSQGVVVLNRDVVTGHVSFNQFVPDPFSFANPDPVAVLVSPDGHHVAVTFQTGGGLAIYSRDQASGQLTLVEFYRDGVDGFNLLRGAWDVEFSNDGKSLYLVTAYEDAIYAFDREVGDYVPSSVSASVSVGETITLDAFGTTNLVPRVESITYSGANPATDAAVDFLVEFTEPVSGVDVSDFTFVGSFAGATAIAVVGSDASYTLSVSLADGLQGTLSPRVSFAGGVVDNEGQPLGGDGSAVFDSIDVDRQAPTLLSSSKLDSEPTNQTNLRYQLTFSEPVTGLDLSDLSVTASGVTGGAVDSVTGSGDTYVVRISYSGGEGTIGLVFADDDSIVDGVGYSLGGPGTSSIPLASYNVLLGTIEGTIFSDLDSNGLFDAGESGVGAMTLFIDVNNDGDLDGGEPTTTSDPSTGTYSFGGLIDGNYTVRWQPQSPYLQTFPSGNASQSVSVAVASGDSTADFGVHFVLPGTIEGVFWDDLDENGLLDIGEVGVAGLTVYVDLNENGAFDAGTEPSYVTDVDDAETSDLDETGQYTFTGLQPGAYTIRVVSSQWQFLDASPWDNSIPSTYTDATNFSADNKTVRISPDGNFAYVFDHLSNKIVVLQMPSTPGGTLTQVQLLTGEFAGTTNAIGDIAFTPDGSTMYVVENQSNQLAVYSRNTSDGTLARWQTVFPPGVFPYSLEVAPDGNHLYVGGGYLAPYSIDPTDGSLTTLVSTATPARVQDIVFNSEGTRLYAADYGNGLIRVYSRDTTTGAITQLQAIDSQITTDLYSLWSMEISDDDQDIYLAAPLTDLIWHFKAQPDGTLVYSQHYDLDTDNIRDIPMDLELSADGKTLLVALGLDNAIQVLHRDTTDGSLSVGSVLGTSDPTIANIYQNSSSLMGLSADGGLLVRANNRAQSLELYQVSDGVSSTATFEVMEAQTSSINFGVTLQSPKVVSVASSTLGPTNATSIDVVVTFDEPVTGVDIGDFAIDASGVSGVSIQSVSGAATQYTVTLDASAATGEGTVVLRVIDNDTIVDADLHPLDGVGTSSNAGQSAAVMVDHQSPTVISIVALNSPIVDSSDVQFTVTFSESVSGVDSGDFAVTMSGSVSAASLLTVTPGAQANTFDVVVSSGTGDGTISLNLSDNDTIVDVVGHALGGVGLSNGDFVGDFAIIERNPLRTINGTVFNDINNDGVRDAGEDGADGSQIFIDLNGNGDLDSGSEPFDWYVTDGIFSFPNLPLGTYTLRVTDRLHYVESAFSTTTVDLGFDDDPLVVDVPATQNQSAFVGVVFDDLNQNGVRDAGEPGISGQRVYWDDDFDGQYEDFDTFVVTTDDDLGTVGDETGTYELSPLWYRLYQIRVDRGPEWLPTSSESADATISSSTQVVNADFGLTPNLTSISGVVFDDVDGDGVQQAGENSAAGWTVFLDADDNGLLDAGESSQTTDATGGYSFDHLALGNHRVRMMPQSGYVITSTDSAFVPIATSTDTANVDFATHANLTTISGHLFDDVNADGVVDAGEGPIDGVAVYLDSNDNARFDVGEPSTITGASGNYTFIDVQPGEVVVRIVPPTGYDQSTPSVPVDRLFVWHGSDTLREVDPTDGSTIADYWQLTYPTTSITAEGLAFDGESLWALDRNQKKIFEIDPDAVTIESQIDISSLGPPTYGVAWNGLAIIDSTIYVSGAGGEMGSVDASTGTLLGFDSVFDSNFASPFLSGVNQLLGVGVSSDGQSLVVSTDADTILTLDPTTLAISGSNAAITSFELSGVGSVGGSTYVSQISSSSLLVFDSVGNQTGTLLIGCQAVAVAGGVYQDHAARLTVALDQQVTGVEFGASQFSGSISGVQFFDDNGNGVLDGGEQPAVGVTVFADLNNNGSRDFDEPFAVSAGDGSYTIEGVSPGSLIVRATSVSHRPSDAYSSQDRLFGLRNLSGFVRIDEIDTTTGSIANSLFTSVPYNIAVAMAFDGQRLIIVDSSDDMLYQVGLDGAIIRSRHLGEPFINQTNGQTEYTAVTDFGPIVVGGTIYTIRSEFGGLTLYSYDAAADEFTKERPISLEWGLESMPVSYNPTFPVANFGSGVSADGKSIVLATDDDRLIEIDLASGIATFSPEQVSSNGFDYAIDSVGGETFIAYSGRIEVVDNDGNLLRTLTAIPTYLGLAGGTYRDNGQVVDVIVGQTATVDHGHVSTGGIISGTIVTDANENGVIDAGESVVAGATVFLDLDRNGLLDAGEPIATSDASGTYSFTGVAPGEYSVRQVASTGTIARAFAPDQTRLFQAIRGTDNLVVIQELDPITSEVLNQFDSPLPAVTSIGLAARENRVYYSRSGAIDVLNANDGTLLDSIPISTGTKDGLAIIGERAYVQDYNQNTIQVVDLVTRRIVDNLDIGLANGGGPGSFNLAFSLAEAPDGVNLAVVPYSGGDVSIVDPSTGVIIDSLSGIYAGTGSASAGGEYYERGIFSNGVQITIFVHDHLGLQRRVLPLTYEGYVYGLGATSIPATEHRVTLFPEQSLSGVDFGEVSESATISGIQFGDVNANGIQDAGEFGLSGVTVFADLNANGFIDAGEPSTVSIGDGSYTLTDVPRGSQWIRTAATGYNATSSLGSSNRMFGTTRVPDASSPTQYVLQIRELDPATGIPIAYTATSIPVLTAYTSAFVNDRLIIVDNGQDKIMQVALDGTLIGESPLPNSGSSFAYAYGPAVIDGTVYVTMIGGGKPLRLERYDLETNQFYGAMFISEDVSQNPSLDPMPQISESVAESPDGKSIVLFSYVDDRAFIVDPLTARVTTVVNLPETGNRVYFAATLAGELYARGSSSSANLNVYDANYAFVRTLGNPQTGGLAAGIDLALGVLVDANSAAIANVDIGQREIHTDVTGIVSYDTNVNGIVDPGEETAGATVYLDANRNGVLDIGEVTTTTFVDGSYSFTQLSAGDYSVAVDHPTSERVVTTAIETALFALEVSGGVSTIRKHDAITGQVLREFSAPGVSLDVAGLAVDDYALYYASPDGVWVLDHDTGAVMDFFDFANAQYDGLAALGGRIFVLNSTTESILSIDPRTGIILDTLAINAINNTSYSFSGNLGESTDGENLIMRMPSGGGLLIDPDTGLIEQWYAYNYGAWAIAGADGELYRSNGGTAIRVESELEQQIRLVPVGYEPRSIAAAVIPASAYDLRAAEAINFTALDFQLAPADQFPTTIISGVVWSDLDHDGMRDAGEAGLPSVTVYIDVNHNHMFDAGDISQTTLPDDPETTAVDESGSYSFAGLPPGIYDVRQVVQTSFVGTSPVDHVLEYDQRYDTDFVMPSQFEDHPLDDLRLSETGRYLVYASTRQVLSEDTNTVRDVYLLDRTTNEQELVSITTAGLSANNNSFEPDVSSDGRYVIFRSWANNLDPADTDNFLDVYIRDRLLGTTTLLTAGINGGPGNGNSRDAIITPDGHFVVLTSWGDQLVTGDTNALADTFVFDLQSNTVQRVSVTHTHALTDGSSWGGDITPDGRYVLFTSSSSQLVPGDTNAQNDIFRKDLITGQVELASASDTGTPGDNKSQKRSISDDGRWVVFDSLASNLTSDAHPGSGEAYYVYLKDMQTGDIKRISNTTVLGAYEGNSQRPEISGDGRFVVFETDGQLVPADTNQRIDVYMYDRLTEELILVSHGDNGQLSRDSSNNAVISADGSTIAFTTNSSNILGLKTIGGIVTVDIEKLLAAHRVQLSTGGQSSGNDFGQVFVTSSITGTLWNDENGDGVLDDTEPRLGGRTLFLDTNNNGAFDIGEPTRVTLADDPVSPTINEAGSYEFAGLSAGNYAVRQILPTGWTQTAPIEVAGIQLLTETDYAHGVNTTTHPIYDSAASDDGRFIAFSTNKSMLPIDTNTGSDLYLMDRSTGDIELVSQSTSGTLANGVSRNVSISGDGRYVVFRSFASNLSAMDSNGTWNIYVRDRQLETTTLVSSAPASQTSGEQVGNSYSYNPKISRDGSVVTFWSNSSNLIDGDTNGQFDVFLKNMQTGTIERINVDSDENQASGGQSHENLPNANGQLVGFWSNATNLVPGDNNASNDVFIRDRQTGLTERVSVSATGEQGNASSDHFSMSDDGRFFAFQSNATNLTSDVGLTGSKQVFLKDRQTGTVTLVSKGDAALPDGTALYPAISSDGRWLTYQSTSSNIVPDDTNGSVDVFLYDTVNATTAILSRNTAGGASDGPSDWPRMSRDGSTIMFNSAATNLVDQSPVSGALYIYRTQSDDPFVMKVALGLDQTLAGNNFGSQEMVDRGDAPQSYGSATHRFDPEIRLGAEVSFDIQTGLADPDDDGVLVTSRLSAGFSGQFEVTTSTVGTLAAWIDFNADGDFDPEERSEFTVGIAESTTTESIVISIPADATLGETYARFRFSTDATSVQLPTGQALNGEVEDYPVTLETPVAATDIALSNTSINENLDTSAADLLFASLAGVDEDHNDSHTFELVPGTGDTDNTKFVISGDQILLKQGEILDYETQSSYTVRIQVSDAAGLTFEKSVELGVNNLVELTKQHITVGDGAAQRSRIDTVTIEFDAEIAIEPNAFVVTKRGDGGGQVIVDFTTRVDSNGHTIADLTFSGLFVNFGSLVDGNYELRVDAAKIVSVGGFGLDANQDGVTGDDFRFGDDAADKFFRLFGDVRGLRAVGAFEFNQFRQSFGKVAVQFGYNQAFDYRGLGVVGSFEFNEFRKRYGSILGWE